MAIKPMVTLTFGEEDAFEIKDSAAREALETLNTELDESKREISEQIGVLERLQPETAMVGHILEVDSVDETGKPLTYRAVENKPDIEVDDTLTQEGMAADAKATGEALKNISVDETLTLEEYQALSEEEKNSDKTFYIKDANMMDINNVVKTDASQIAFDNTDTTLTSKEVQGALVEVDNKISEQSKKINVKFVTTAGTHVDDYVEAGVYYFVSANQPTGAPCANGWLKVDVGSGSIVRQTWFRVGSVDSCDDTFTRTKVSGTWSAWSQYITTKNIQIGTASITTETANIPKGHTITFPTAFESVPSVFANAKTSAPGTGMTGISVTDITKTGCTIYVTRSAANATTGINWVAIGA